MSKELSPTNWELTEDKIKVLAQAGIIPPNTPPAQVAVFIETARRHGLDPFTKEVHLVGYGGNYSVIVGINGLRGKASDTGLHAGTDDPLFDLQPDGQYRTLATLTKANMMPETCTVTVYKMMQGQRVPFTATASFKEFTTGKNKWATMPYQMIMKVAESHALRKAFPRQVAGLYLDEEMQQSATVVEVASKPELTPEHPMWDKCVEAIKSGRTVADARKKYTVSDVNANLLLSEATALELTSDLQQTA